VASNNDESHSHPVRAESFLRCENPFVRGDPAWYVGPTCATVRACALDAPELALNRLPRAQQRVFSARARVHLVLHEWRVFSPGTLCRVIISLRQPTSLLLGILPPDGTEHNHDHTTIESNRVRLRQMGRVCVLALCVSPSLLPRHHSADRLFSVLGGAHAVCHSLTCPCICR
jgi:hypothetical protein